MFYMEGATKPNRSRKYLQSGPCVCHVHGHIAELKTARLPPPTNKTFPSTLHLSALLIQRRKDNISTEPREPGKAAHPEAQQTRPGKPIV